MKSKQGRKRAHNSVKSQTKRLVSDAAGQNQLVPGPGGIICTYPAEKLCIVDRSAYEP